MSEEEKIVITWERSLMIYAIERMLDQYHQTPARDMLLYLVTDLLTIEQIAQLVRIYFTQDDREIIDGEDQ